MEIRLLGPAVRVLVDGRVADAGTLKERSILAVLALSAGKAVPTATLVERIWGPSPSASVRSSLYSCIARIRSRLESAGSEVGLRKLPHGYALEIAPDAVDWHRVRNLRRQARDLAESGDHRTAVVLLSTALSLWEGEPLAEIPGDWIHGHRASMNQTRLLLVDSWAQSCLRIGHYDDVIASVSETAARHPNNERLATLLMEALAGSGRHAEAADVYHRLRGVLAEEGNNPGGPAQAAFQRVLAGQSWDAEGSAESSGAPRANAEPAAAAPPAPAAPAAPRVHDSLPRDISDFTARGPELAEILSRASERPGGTTVAVITGMAGVGKTALAVRAAHLLRDDFDVRLQLDLHGHSPGQAPAEPGEALHTLLRELEVEPERIPPETQARAALWSSRLAGKRVLLVLDDAAPGRVAPLIPGTPGCVVLVTSRWQLTELDGVHHLRLFEPAESEAAGMLAAFAGLGPDGEGDTDVRRVAHACGRLPIALRVAGARLRRHPAWTPGHVADRIARNGLAEMRSFSHDVASVFEMSMQALGDAARAAFLRVGAHPAAELSLSALAAALGDRTPHATVAESAAEELLETNLIEEIAPGRYRVHGLLSEFARLRAAELLPVEERRAALLRLLDYYWSAGDTADRTVHPERRRARERPSASTPPPPFSGAAEARRWFEGEYPAITAAIAGARDGEFVDSSDVRRYAVRLPLAIAGLSDSDGPWEHAEHDLAACLKLCREQEDDGTTALAAFELSCVQRRLRRLDDAEENAEAALAQWWSEGDVAGEALARDQLGLVYCDTARSLDAVAEHEEALRLYRTVGDLRGCASALDHLGICRTRTGDYDAAEAAFEDALGIWRAAGERPMEARTMVNSAWLLLERGYHRDAQRMCEQSRALFLDAGDRRAAAQASNNIGEVALYRQEYGDAVAHFSAARDLFRELGDDHNAIQAEAGLGRTQVACGRAVEAQETLRQALSAAGRLRDCALEAELLLALGDASVALKRDRDGRLHYQNARELAGRGVSASWEQGAHDRLGDLSIREGRGAEARTHWGRALMIARALKSPQERSIRLKIDLLGHSESIAL